MRNNSLAQTALVVLVAGGIIGGLLTVGGPGQRRKERGDDERLAHIQTLDDYVTCLAKRNANALPAEMPQDSFCSGHDRLSDPFTDTPYRYEKLGEDKYQICANFESPETVPTYRLTAFDRNTGCYTHNYKP